MCSCMHVYGGSCQRSGEEMARQRCAGLTSSGFGSGLGSHPTHSGNISKDQLEIIRSASEIIESYGSRDNVNVYERFILQEADKILDKCK